MKILVAHNFYQITGGEDVCFKAESDLLECHGQTVIRYTRNNAEIRNYNLWQKINLGMNTIWSKRSFRDVEVLLQNEKPDIVHFQNTFPLISPSVFYACKSRNIPVVLTLHNYRMMCLNGLFLRDSQICEDCRSKAFAWPGIVHACYRGSHLESSAVAMMNAYHRMRKTWVDCVDTCICLSEFSKRKYVQAGLPEEKIRVVPNFLPDPGEDKNAGDYAVFVGRLSPEKGVQHLLEAAADNTAVPLKIIGSGPLDAEVKRDSEELENVSAPGWLEHHEMLSMLQKARFLINPTLCYETFSRTVMEAYACGVPVIASRIGAVEELVQDGVTGLLVTPGDVEDLAEKMRWLWTRPEEARRMGKNARKYYLEHLTPDAHYETLMQIYTSVLEGKK